MLKTGIEKTLWNLHEQIAGHYDMKILEQEILPDHVHMLVSAPQPVTHRTDLQEHHGTGTLQTISGSQETVLGRAPLDGQLLRGNGG